MKLTLPGHPAPAQPSPARASSATRAVSSQATGSSEGLWWEVRPARPVTAEGSEELGHEGVSG